MFGTGYMDFEGMKMRLLDSTGVVFSCLRLLADQIFLLLSCLALIKAITKQEVLVYATNSSIQTKVLGTEVCYIDPGVSKFGLENILCNIPLLLYFPIHHIDIA
jgi:hypothetical protein